MLCVYSLGSHYQGDSNNHIQQTIILWKMKKASLNLFLCASRSGAMSNPQWLEQLMSRTNLHSPRGI